jgi:hypothetical protein
LNVYLELNDIFHSRWYIALLGLLSLCLVAITVKRLPTVWRQRGLGAGLGILLAHLGILTIIGGAIYGGVSGFRYYARLIEGEVTVLPALPFVIKLDRLSVKFYPEETFRHLGPDIRLAERQESAFTLLHHGSPFLRATASPGRPVVARGVTLLPSEKDLGRAFTLVILAPNGLEKVIPIRPWAPPLITLGFGNQTRILAHRLVFDESAHQGAEGPRRPTATEIIQLKQDGSSRSLGFASDTNPLKYGEWSFSVERIQPYTGIHVYSRPEKPFLIAGFVILMVGLLWFFVRVDRIVGLLKPVRRSERTSRHQAPGEGEPESAGPKEGVAGDVVHHRRD